MDSDFTRLSDQCHQVLEACHKAREEALEQTRLLTRHSANTIRAVHRQEYDLATELLNDARSISDALKINLQPYPELYFSGYTQDSIKEYVEARLTFDLIKGNPLPLPEELNVEISTYLRGLSETIGELRRKCLDILRQGYSAEAERLLDLMDEIYALLVTVDYPDAVTHGLRRQTDLARGIIERTRADLTTSLREECLQKAIVSLENRLDANGKE
ncbi:MAG: haloacid dehalogenase [Anaerolineaceae bacterium]|jgi:translin|nr:MAG: haloacid dehalogenase [Anaerolineaceae bacterium]